MFENKNPDLVEVLCCVAGSLVVFIEVISMNILKEIKKNNRDLSEKYDRLSRDYYVTKGQIEKND